MQEKNAADHCSHGGSLYAYIGQNFSGIAGAAQIIAADVLDAWYPPSPKVLDLLQRHLSWACRTSPPTRGVGLKNVLAQTFQLPEKRIILGNGSSDLIFRLLPHIFHGEGPVVIPAPSYGEYAHVIEHVCGKPIAYFSSYESGFKIDVEELLDFMQQVQASGLILINPCNPTGQYLTNQQLRSLLDQIPGDIPTVIDETYFAYMPSGDSMQSEIDRYPQLWIFRSLSKVYALSGLRVGYALVPESKALEMDLLTPTYTVPTLTQMAAIAALLDDDYASLMVQETCTRREHFRQQLLQIPGLQVPPSHINSLLLDLQESGWQAGSLQQRLAQHKLLVRNISSQGHRESERYLRISVQDYPVNARSASIIREVLPSL